MDHPVHPPVPPGVAADALAQRAGTRRQPSPWLVLAVLIIPRVWPL